MASGPTETESAGEEAEGVVMGVVPMGAKTTNMGGNGQQSAARRRECSGECVVVAASVLSYVELQAVLCGV